MAPARSALAALVCLAAARTVMECTVDHQQRREQQWSVGPPVPNVAVTGITGGGWGVFGRSNTNGTGVVGVSDTGLGVDGAPSRPAMVGGRSPDGFGVAGFSNHDDGVVGFSEDGSSGVRGISGTGFVLGSGTGVAGQSGSGHGVVGESNSGNGVRGFSWRQRCGRCM